MLGLPVNYSGEPTPVTIVRPYISPKKAWPVLVGMILALFGRAWILMLILGSIGYPQGYWRTLLIMLAIGYLLPRYDSFRIWSRQGTK